MAELRDGLCTQNYTKVTHEDDFEFNAPHHFQVVAVEPASEGGPHLVVGEVNFQKGPIKENGVNGVCNEDLINMVRARLIAFQNSEYACRENAVALTKLEEALMWLRKRTDDRIARNVEGTSAV